MRDDLWTLHVPAGASDHSSGWSPPAGRWRFRIALTRLASLVELRVSNVIVAAGDRDADVVRAAETHSVRVFSRPVIGIDLGAECPVVTPGGRVTLVLGPRARDMDARIEWVKAEDPADCGMREP